MVKHKQKFKDKSKSVIFDTRLHWLNYRNRTWKIAVSIPRAVSLPPPVLEPGTLPRAVRGHPPTEPILWGLGIRGDLIHGGCDCERVAREEFAWSISGHQIAQWQKRPSYFLQKILAYSFSSPFATLRIQCLNVLFFLVTCALCTGVCCLACSLWIWFCPCVSFQDEVIHWEPNLHFNITVLWENSES